MPAYQSPADQYYALRASGLSDADILAQYGPNSPVGRIIALNNRYAQAAPDASGYRYQFASPAPAPAQEEIAYTNAPSAPARGFVQSEAPGLVQDPYMPGPSVQAPVPAPVQSSVQQPLLAPAPASAQPPVQQPLLAPAQPPVTVQMRPVDQVARGIMPSLPDSPYAQSLARAQEANPVVPPAPMTMEDLRNVIFDGLRGLGRYLPDMSAEEANPAPPSAPMTMEDLRNVIFDGLRGLGSYIPDFGGAADYAGAAATGVANNARAAYTSPEGYAPTPEVVEMVRNTQPPQYPQPDPQYGWYGTLMQTLAAPREALYNWLTR